MALDWYNAPCLIFGRSSVQLSDSLPDLSSGMKSAPYAEFGTGVYCLLHHQILPRVHSSARKKYLLADFNCVH
jgi:hypothetical protein